MPRLEVLEDRRVLSGGPGGSLLVFGDSLSDKGNLFLATGGSVPNPSIYSQGRFSNGPLWVDTLAKYVGAPAVQPSLAGGLDYAFGGATVAATDPTVPSVSQQVGLYLSGHTPAANDLVAVWAGANDFFDTLASPAGPISPFQSADTLAASLDALAGAGARRFVVPNLPPLGQTPFVRGLGAPGLSAAADQWAAAFDARLGADLAAFASSHPDATVVGVDVPGLFQQIIQPSNPFGFVNTTDPVGPLLPGGPLLAAVTAPDPQDYLFFDGIHPTSKGHQLAGLRAAAGVYDALGARHLVVTSTADTVDPAATGLSLREMVNLSNAMHGAQTITFQLGAGSHQIKLGGKELPVTQDLAIKGPGQGLLTVSGEGKTRAFSVTGASTSVALSGLTVADARATGVTLTSPFGFPLTEGGGLFVNAAHVTMSDVTFTNDQAVGVASAGGAVALVFGASLSASHATFNDNVSQGAVLGAGGAIAADAGCTLTVDHALFAGNQAAALLGASLTNPFQGAGLGGAVAVAGGSTASLTRVTFVGNVAKGGSGPGDLGGAGDGGAAFVTPDSVLGLPTASSLSVRDGTFWNNRAQGGDGNDGPSGGKATDGGSGLGGAIRDAGAHLSVSDSVFGVNQAVGGTGGKGAAGGNGGAGGGAFGGAVHVVVNDLPFAQFAPTVEISGSLFIDNAALGGIGGAGGPGGNGGNGGLSEAGAIRVGFGVATLSDDLIVDNLARGGAGGAKGVGGARGGDGGDGQAGGLHTAGFGFPAKVTVTDTVIADNQAVGGAGAAGGNGGNGQGGGIFADVDSTLTLVHALVTDNEARGGKAGAGGTAGQGIGGGICNLGTILIGPRTRVWGNEASTAFDDCFGC